MTTTAERSRVLVGENRRWHEQGNLPLRLYRLERGAHRDFSLSVTHVANEQTVHRPYALHVRFHFRGGFALLGRVLEEPGRLELALPCGIGNVRGTGRHSAARVEIEQLDGHLVDRGALLLSLLAPAFAAKLV